MRVLVTGDSWGCGVWKNKQVVHEGLVWYLQHKYNHTVTNVSKAGCSNLRNLHKLRTTNLNEYDFIIVYYSNPFLDIKTTDDFSYFNVPDKSLDDNFITQLHENLTCTYLKNLNSLSKKIYLVGGHNKVSTQYINYNNVIALIPSIREFFYPTFIEPEVISSCYVFDMYTNKFDDKALEHINKSRTHMRNLSNIQKEYFHPNGYHLNLKGHAILAEFIHNFMANQ